MTHSSSTPKNPDWWRGAVIYQIYPRSFLDSNGDGVGDLPGIEQRLEHVAQLGADGIWISPFFKSPMKDFGYDVEDYRDVDPIFGSLADFDRLLSRAHQLGLKVLIDQVLSHTSERHAWFQESRLSRDNPKADWYVWADAQADGTPPNNWLSVFGGPAWQWDSRRRQYYMHSFLASQPDLNFHQPEVQAAVLDEVRFWCERGVDGFRFDACNHQFHDALLRSNPAVDPGLAGTVSTVQAENPYALQQHLYDKSRPENLAFLAQVRAVLDAYGATSVGEVGDENAPPLMAQYTARDQRLHMAYSFSLLTRDGSPAHVRNEVERLVSELQATGGWGCWALSNHDAVRVATRWSPTGQPDSRQARMLLAMVTSLPGSVCLYQGEELGLPEADVPYEQLQDPYGLAFWPEFKGRDGCRTPMPWQAQAVQGGFSSATPWLPMSSDQQRLAVDVQAADPESPLNFARAWLAWRKTQSVLIDGDVRFFDAPSSVLLFERHDPVASASRLLAFNFTAEPCSLALPATWLAGSALLQAPIPAALRGRVEDAQLQLPPFGLYIGHP